MTGEERQSLKVELEALQIVKRADPALYQCYVGRIVRDIEEAERRAVLKQIAADEELSEEAAIPLVQSWLLERLDSGNPECQLFSLPVNDPLRVQVEPVWNWLWSVRALPQVVAEEIPVRDREVGVECGLGDQGGLAVEPSRPSPPLTPKWGIRVHGAAPVRPRRRSRWDVEGLL